MTRENTNIKTTIALMSRDISYIKDEVKNISKRLEDDYVTKDAFDPVKRIAYGLVGLIVSGVILALLGLVIRVQG